MAKSAVWIRYEKAQGVRFREHEERSSRKGSKQKDRYWQLIYKYQGKTKVEILGWETEGWTETTVVELAARLAGNRSKGVVPGTFAEYRAVNTAEKEEKEAKIQAIQKQEEQEKAFKRTFAEVVQPYFEERKGEVKNQRTHKDEISKCYKWLIPHFGDLSMSEITPGRIIAFIKECLKPTQKIKEYGKTKAAVPKPRSGGTITHYVHVLGQIWDWSKKKGYCSGDNPAQDKEVLKAIPKSDGQRYRFLTREETDMLLPALKERSVQLWAKCVIMLYCGLRPIEVHRLKWCDIDFQPTQIRVYKEIETNKGKTRIVPFRSTVESMLSEIKPDSFTPDTLVFPPASIRKERENGDAAQSWEISDVFQDVVNGFGWNEGRSQNDKVVPYTLRHTYASWLVQAGRPLYTISKLLGHSTTEVTNRYAHLAPDNLRAAIDIFESV